MHKILCIGDLHFPWTSKACLDFIFDVIKRERPPVIVQVGDLYDFFSMGRFPRDSSICTPAQEVAEGRQAAEEFWAHIKRLSPISTKYQLRGNHDIRPIKAIRELAPNLEPFLKINDFFKFPDVETIFDPREELQIGDTLFMHGYRSKLGDHMKHNRMNTVVGHSHRGGVFYERFGDKILWELNCGYVGDPLAKVFTYTPQKMSPWTLGVGLIDEHGPRFIPYHKKKSK